MKSKWKLLYATIATASLLAACGTDTGKENPNGNTNGSTGNVEETVDIMKDAKVTDSDEQDYSIAVLPHYNLTSEEPGKDSLFTDKDGAYFMRIETTVNEDGMYDYFAENMVAVLEAASGGSKPIELTDEASIPSGEGIENAKVLSVQTNNGPVTGIVFERGNMAIRLTVFDSPKEEYFANFLLMGETIINK